MPTCRVWLLFGARVPSPKREYGESIPVWANDATAKKSAKGSKNPFLNLSYLIEFHDGLQTFKHEI
jgi:hypothetical protein